MIGIGAQKTNIFFCRKGSNPSEEKITAVLKAVLLSGFCFYLCIFFCEPAELIFLVFPEEIKILILEPVEYRAKFRIFNVRIRMVRKLRKDAVLLE